MDKFFFFFFFLLFRFAHTAYGSSQARGLIGATAAGPYHSSRQCQILNPGQGLNLHQSSDPRCGSDNTRLLTRLATRKLLSKLLFAFLGPQPLHMEVPKLGVKLELQLPGYARATTMPDTRGICELHHSSRQRRIPNPLSEAMDQTQNLIAPSRICFHRNRRVTRCQVFDYLRKCYLLKRYICIDFIYICKISTSAFNIFYVTLVK